MIRHTISDQSLLGWWSRLGITAIVIAIFFSFDIDRPRIADSQTSQTEITGKVINGTTEGDIPINTEVLLLAIDLINNQIIEEASTLADENGIFQFKNVVPKPGANLRVVANAGTYTPSVDMQFVDNWQDVVLTIYEETVSLEQIKIKSYVLMIPTINARERQAGVLSVINLSNIGDRVWIPDLKNPNLTGLELLRFNLPLGYTNLSVESDLPPGNIMDIATGFAMTNPVPPGDATILISYIVPYEGDGFDFILKLPYGATEIRMLLADEAGSISSDNLHSTEQVTVADSLFNAIQGSNFVADEKITISFRRMPQPTPLQEISEFLNSRSYIYILAGMVGLTLITILAYAIFKSQRQTRTDQDKLKMARRMEIIREIAALDENYENHHTDESEYKKRRNKLKQKVAAIEEASSQRRPIITDESPKKPEK
tara:strand:- start:1687 stop:2973 length:1287 start_codon:yes stop_codon:yes gene_type:complete